MSTRKNSKNYKNQFTRLVGKILVLKGTINNSRAFLSLASFYHRFSDFGWISNHGLRGHKADFADVKWISRMTKNMISPKNIRSVGTGRKVLVLKGTINNGRVFPSLAFLYRGFWDFGRIARMANIKAKPMTSSKKRPVATGRTISAGQLIPSLSYFIAN